MLLALLLRLPGILITRALERLGILSPPPRPEPEPWAPEPEEATAARNGPPPPTAAEALARSAERAAAAPPPAPMPLREAEPRHVDREAVIVESVGPAEEVGATIQVDEPWDGYASMPASAIVTRLRGADEATKAVVRLYEAGHKNRMTVLRATG